MEDNSVEQLEPLQSSQNGFIISFGRMEETEKAVQIEYDLTSTNFSSVYSNLDKGWSWVVLFATYMSFVVMGGCVYTTGIVHTILLERFGESNATTAWAASLFSALSSLAGPVSSFLIDRFSCRTAMIISGILVALGFVGTAFAPNIYVAIITFGLVAGLGIGCGYIAVFTTPGFNFHSKLNLAMGLANSGAGVGIFFMGPLIQLAREHYGSSGCFLILASFALHTVVFGALMRPSVLELETHKLKRMKGHTHRTASSAPFTMYFKLCTDKCVMCLSLSLFFFSIASFAIFIHLPNFCIHNGYSSLQASFLISVSGSMTIACRILTGIAANAPDIDEITIYLGSMWIQSFATFLLPLYGKWYEGQMVYAAIIGLYYGCCYVVLPPINKKAVGVENMASALGIEYFLGGIGTVIGPVIAGNILDEAGNYGLVFMICAVFLLLSGLFGLATVIFTKQKQYPPVRKREENGHLNEPNNTIAPTAESKDNDIT